MMVICFGKFWNFGGKLGAVITVVSLCILMVLVGFEESRIFGRML